MLDKYQFDDKENIPTIDSLNYSAMKFPAGLFPPQSVKKASKVKPKPQKNLNNSVRAGDWICLVCNNLNFSFRNECNRCQMQTKKQNYIQNLLLISDKKPGMMPLDRPALKDLTNISIEEGQNPKLGSYNTIASDQETHYTSSLPPGLSQHAPRSTNNSQSKFDDYDFSPNYGFENALLLTPPRFNANQQNFTSPQPDVMESHNKMILPYQSPKQLPSVSPILRKVLSYADAPSEEFHNAKYLKYKTTTGTYHQRSNSQNSKEQTEERCNKTEGNHSCDDINCDNFNFEEINKCIQETILGEAPPNGVGHHMNTADRFPTFIDFGSFNNPMMKDNINPALLNVEKNYATLFAGFMNDDNSKSNTPTTASSTGSNQGKKERKSDWICQWCNNLNYSFRKFCNRCQIMR